MKVGNIVKNINNEMLVLVVRIDEEAFVGKVIESSGYYPVGYICKRWSKDSSLWEYHSDGDMLEVNKSLKEKWDW